MNLTDPERRAVAMVVRARMRGEFGTFHELLRGALKKLEATESRPEPPRRFTFADRGLERAVKRMEDQD